MSQQDNIFNAKLIKVDGKLIHVNKGTEAIYNEFVKSLEEGQEVTVFFEANKDDGTNDQLAKIHVCIRKLASEIGYTFEEMKLELKRKAGLVYKDHVKSFADCSKEELGLVIEAIKEAGEMVNISF